MKLIDEVKKLRDECRKEETYYNERFNLWMKYKGESWPELPSDAAACQSVGAMFRDALLPDLMSGKIDAKECKDEAN